MSDKKVIRTGFEKLNEIISGFYPNEVVLIGAKPFVGKTAFLATLINEICLNQKQRGLMFSLEMGEDNLKKCLAAINTGIPIGKIRKEVLTIAETTKVEEAFTLMNNDLFFINDKPSLKIDELCEHATIIAKEKHIKIIFIDYLGLISTKNDKELSQLQTIKKLKILSQSLHIPIVVTCQLSHLEYEGEPTLSQLCAHEQIESYADIILLLHRNTESLAKVIVAKNRDEKTGEIMLSVIADTRKFEDIK